MFLVSMHYTLLIPTQSTSAVMDEVVSFSRHSQRHYRVYAQQRHTSKKKAPKEKHTETLEQLLLLLLMSIFEEEMEERYRNACDHAIRRALKGRTGNGEKRQKNKTRRLASCEFLQFAADTVREPGCHTLIDHVDAVR